MSSGPPAAGGRRRPRIFRSFGGLLGDTLWSVLHDGSLVVQAFLSFTLLSLTLTRVEYGAYTSAWALIGPISAMTSGVGLALLQRIIGEGDDPDRALRTFLALMLLSTGLGGLAVLALAVWTIDLTVADLVMMVVGELVCIGVITIGSFLIQSVSGFPPAARVRLGVIVIRFVVVLALYFSGNLTITNLVAGHLAGFVIYGAFLVIRHLPRHGFRMGLSRPTGVAVRSTGMFTAPMAASKVQTEFDRYLVYSFGHRSDAGLYAAAYRVLLLGIAPLAALDAAAFQRFLPKGDDTEQGVHWRRAVRLGSVMVGFSTVTAIAVYLAMPLVELLVLHGEFDEAATIIPWLLILMPVIATTNAPMNGLLGLGRADIRMRVYLLAALVAVVCYGLLIPAYSWRGAVIGTFISEVFLSVVAWSSLWRHQRKADQQINRRRLLPVT